MAAIRELVAQHVLPRRTVTLVVGTRDDGVLGATEPFEVGTPWWQDVAPIVERFPAWAVLSMLDVERPPGLMMGGHVTYLVEPLGAVEPFAETGGPDGA